MTRKRRDEKDNWSWIYTLKPKNLPVSYCSKNKEHKFIAREGQTICYFCELGKPYPPPMPVNLYADDDWDVPDLTDLPVGIPD